TTTERGGALRIPVLARDESFLFYPLQLKWASLPDTLYVGQAVPLILVMNNMEEIILPESISMNTPDSALLEEVSGLGDIEFSVMETTTLFNVPMQTWMLTPSRPGTMTLGAARVSVLGLNRSTESQSITVRPLPEEAAVTGAVGDFRYSYELSEESFTVDDPVTLKVRVEGEGNLNYLVLPEPEFPESLNVISRESSSFRASERGFEGYREVQYTITATGEGAFRITVPRFDWLNPGTGRTSSAAGRELNLEAVSLLDSLHNQDLVFTLLGEDQLLKGDPAALYRIPIAYLMLLPGILVLILSRFRRIRKTFLIAGLLVSGLFLSAALPESDGTPWISEAAASYEAEEYQEALSHYRINAPEWEENWAFQYNKGILHFMAKEDARAVASLRKALYLSGNRTVVRDTLGAIENGLGLENQLPISFSLPPNLIFILFVLSVNLLMITLSRVLLRNSALPVLFLLIFSLSTLTSGFALGRNIWLLSRNEAVLRGSAGIRRIPEEGGSTWITVPEGTSVELLSGYGDFSLIRSAYGLEGWIHNSELILIKGDRL
ncbi:MAG: hypothetical protein PQJ50_14785, partial [Spirochaetales bacterium]|nr:hypothetical protein [Spirochaetales bacterium]